MIRTVKCKIEQREVEPQAWIGTLRALENQIHSKGEGMCAGSFKVHIDVNEENGNMDSKHFIIKVPRALHWPLLTVETLECDCPK
jgi:hypothetical protein